MINQFLSIAVLDVRLYLGLDAKTPGWMAGQAFLDRALTVWSGVRVGVF